MLPRNDPDRIQIAFDDHRLVAMTLGCCFRSPWPIVWDWARCRWWTATLTWAVPLGEPTLGTRC